VQTVLFLQTLITGLSIGGILRLMAVGYSLVFSVLNFSNIRSWSGYHARRLRGTRPGHEAEFRLRAWSWREASPERG
jgi:hypothetical protein